MLVAQCPACGARYQVPDEVAGRKARCKKCSRPFTLPMPQPDSGRLELTPMTGASTTQTGTVVMRNRPDEAGTGALRRGAGTEPGQPARPGRAFPDYLVSLGRAALLGATPASIALFAVTWFILFLREILVSPWFVCPGVGLAGWFVLTFWYLAYQMNVVVHASSGEATIPAPTMAAGWVDDLLVPGVKMWIADLVAYLPALVFAAVVMGGAVSWRQWAGQLGAAIVGTDLATPAQQQPGLGAALLAAGWLLWPALIVALARGGATAALRLDRVLLMIGRAAPAYLVTVLVALTSPAAHVGLRAWLLHPQPTGGPVDLVQVLLVPAAVVAAEVYTALLAARAAGLFYHHFRNIFPALWA